MPACWFRRLRRNNLEVRDDGTSSPARCKRALPGGESVLPDSFGERDVAGFEIQLGFGGSAEDLGAVIVELAFPSRDDDGGETVTDQVYADAGGSEVGSRMSEVGEDA